MGDTLRRRFCCFVVVARRVVEALGLAEVILAGLLTASGLVWGHIPISLVRGKEKARVNGTASEVQ